MGQDSKRKRFLRRVKRALTLQRQQVELQKLQLQELVGMVVKQRQELTTAQAEIAAVLGVDIAAPTPSFTVETMPNDPDNYYAADGDHEYNVERMNKEPNDTDANDSNPS